MPNPNTRLDESGKRLPVNHCLYCGYKVDAASHMEDEQARPAPGCLSVCMKCGAVMMYAYDMTLRGLSDAEVKEVADDTGLMVYLAKLVTGIHFIQRGKN